MNEAIAMIVKAFLEFGPLGILSLAGWGIAVYFLYRDIKKKDAANEDIKKKDQEIINAKDKLADTIKDLSDKRLEDAKELIADYNTLATSQIQTLDKLTAALEVRNQFRGNDASNG
jgi:hypothetical protein